MPSLLRPRVWTSQPQYPVQIDWSNPLTSGLHVCFSGASPYNLAKQKLATQSGLSTTFNQFGVAYGWVNSTDKVSYTAGNEFETGALDATCFCIGQPATSSQTGGRRIFHYGATALGTTGGLLFSTTATTGQAQIIFGAGAGVQTIASTSVTYFDTTAVRRYCLVHRNGVAGDFYRDGIFIETVANAISRNASSDATVTLLNRPDNTRGWGGQSNLILTWNRALSASEVNSISNNPWQIFAPQVT